MWFSFKFQPLLLNQMGKKETIEDADGPYQLIVDHRINGNY